MVHHRCRSVGRFRLWTRDDQSVHRLDELVGLFPIAIPDKAVTVKYGTHPSSKPRHGNKRRRTSKRNEANMALRLGGIYP